MFPDCHCTEQCSTHCFRLIQIALNYFAG
uniref:Uncharacterized protein n=1 Tax=Anguilla anguilla TaxID=7936 RepID=A0A0E9PB52_ANGAN